MCGRARAHYSQTFAIEKPRVSFYIKYNGWIVNFFQEYRIVWVIIRDYRYILSLGPINFLFNQIFKLFPAFTA